MIEYLRIISLKIPIGGKFGLCPAKPKSNDWVWAAVIVPVGAAAANVNCFFVFSFWGTFGA